jgi:hypothetical protein
MRTTRVYLGILAVGFIVLLVASLTAINAGQVTGESVRIDNDDLGGVVSGAKGPEAGVWVIAETIDLPTKFVRIVVTDDRGRYVVPDLPKANYNVWVRGYGLVDSPKVQAAPGKIVNLTAVVAPNPREAAQYYPPNYWYSLLQVPAKSEFPGTGAKGNGISETIKSQAAWLTRLKVGGCETCHQLGNKATRELPESLGRFDSSAAAWERRVQSGQAGGGMNNQITQFGRQRVLAMYADWTDRIAAGELPPVPPRPQGVERNVVITEWDYGDPKKYTHDGNSTDKRNPTVNANGPIYIAPEVSSDDLYVVDPVRHTASELRVPLRDPKTPPAAAPEMPQPSPYWGEEVLWTGRTSPHSSMMDRQGRLWTASRIRPAENPAWCREGSAHPSAKLYPLKATGRQLSVYDPKSKQWTLADTCFGTHHLMFSEDANNTLWFTNAGTGAGDVVGWFNTKMFDETKDEQKSQGWAPFILDTNGNGRQDAWVEPDQPLDPTKDKRVGAGLYSVVQNPVDGAIWGSISAFPGAIVRVNLGSNPPMTTLTEIYEPPFDHKTMTGAGYTVRTLDVDRNGVLWVTLTGSSHLASFDRRKCKGPLNGPTATGQQCPEGWTLYPLPGPQFKGVTEPGSAEGTYINWVDQFDTFGLGKNTPFTVGNGSDSLLGLSNGKFVILRVPYPMGFYAKGMDGRIDDPNGGWKGKGLWAGSGTRAPFHQEGGKGTKPKLMKFQLRPDPLAK